jgi:FtsZ-binding cell division protein ZapB
MKSLAYTFQFSAKLFLIGFCLFLSTGLFAQPAATLSVQGVLTKSDGTAVDDGNYNVTFRLWNDSIAGSKKYEEVISVQTIGGVYSAIMGATDPVNHPLNAAFNEIYWLGVSVNGSSELTPRPRLTQAPYALSLIGSSNIFPSAGTVKADAIIVPGGAPAGGVAGKGYSFGAGGDQDGGMFSSGDDQVSLYANAVERLRISGSGISAFPGAPGVTVYGPLTSNDVVVNGTSTTNGLIRTTTGLSFKYPTINDDDSGIFAAQDGEFQLRSNGIERVLIGSNGTTYFKDPGGVFVQTSFAVSGPVKLYSVPDFNGKNMQWDPATGLVGADNSSRRFKYNIKPLVDDFTLILKAQPKTYTRKINPNKWEYGYIAEEMDSLGLKKLVEYDTTGTPDGFNYVKMILYVTEVLKIHQTEVEKLHAEIAELRSKNATLSTENTSLRADNNGLQNKQAEFSAQLNELSKRMRSLENTTGLRK